MTESKLLIVAASGFASERKSHFDAALRNAFLQDTLVLARSLPPKSQVRAAVAVDDGAGVFAPDVRFAEPTLFTLTADSPARRLRQMFDFGFANGADFVCVIGPQTPHLPTSYVLEAFGRLKQHPDAVVIGPAGPAEGGDRYLLGVGKSAFSRYGEDILASAPNSIAETLQRALANELSVSLLPSIQLIDTQENLKRLLRDLRRGVATAPQTQSLLRNTGLE